MQILAEARALIKKLLFIMLMIVLFSFVAQADLNDGVIAYYTLDETSGTTAIDSLGNYNGSKSSTLVNNGLGIINSGGNFSQNNGIDFGNVLDWNGQTARSWSFWYNPKDSRLDYVFAKQLDSGTYRGHQFLYDKPNNRFQFDVYNNIAGTLFNQVYFNINLPLDSEMFMITLVVPDNNANNYKLYVNGTLITSTTITRNMLSTNTAATTSPFNIGGRDNIFNTYYSISNIDEFAIWNRTLNSTEITELYDSQKDGFNTGQYPFFIIQTITVNDIWTNQALNFTTNNYSGLINPVNLLKNYTDLDLINSYSEDFIQYTFRRFSADLINASVKVYTGTIFNTTQIPQDCYLNSSIDFKLTSAFTGQNFLYCINKISLNEELIGQFNTAFGGYLEHLNFTFIDTVIISAPGYYTRTYYNYTNPLDAQLLKQSYNGSELAIKDFWSNNNITTASINISETDYQTANISVSAPGYFGQTFTNYNISTLFTTILTPSATINTIFLEEITSLIKNNVTFDLIGDSYSRKFTTTNGTSFIENLSAGTYEIRFSLNDLQYRPRSYYLIIPLQDSGQANFTLRVLPENQSQIFTRRIVDQNSQPLSNSIFELQRYYTNSSSWVTVERALVSTQGDAVFSAVPNTQAYRYRVYDSEFTLLETSNSFFLIDTTSEIRISDTSDLLANYNSYRNTISSLSISNSSNLVLEYNDPSGTTQEVCLFVSYSYQSNVTTTNTCSQETSATIVQQINQSAPGRYDIIATAEFNDGEVFLISNQNFKFDSTDGQQFIGVLAWLVLLMGFAVCAVLSYINPIPGVVFMFFMLLAFSPYVLGMVEVSTVATSTVGVIALITLLVFFRYR